jgi:hypothetical protein
MKNDSGIHLKRFAGETPALPVKSLRRPNPHEKKFFARLHHTQFGTGARFSRDLNAGLLNG